MEAKLPPEARLPRPVARAGARLDSANLKPLGRYLAKDVCELLHVPRPVRTLLDCGCVTGQTVVEDLKGIKRNRDQSVVRPVDQPLSATRGIVGFKSNLAPAEAVVKVAGLADLKSTDPARFDGEEARGGIVKNKKYREGKVLVIRYAGRQGGPGMRGILPHGAVRQKACHAEV
jgi:dihydroxy-acid dehydratase